MKCWNTFLYNTVTAVQTLVTRHCLCCIIRGVLSENKNVNKDFGIGVITHSFILWKPLL